MVRSQAKDASSAVLNPAYDRVRFCPAQLPIFEGSTRRSSRRSRTCSLTAPTKITANQAPARTMITTSVNGIFAFPLYALGFSAHWKANIERAGWFLGEPTEQGEPRSRP
jgi:hypothetical protein